MHFVALINFTSHGSEKISNTTVRAETFAASARAQGVQIEQLLWTQGRFDGLLVFEAPDPETAAAAMLALSSKGFVKTETMVAFDREGMDRILVKSK